MRPEQHPHHDRVKLTQAQEKMWRDVCGNPELQDLKKLPERTVESSKRFRKKAIAIIGVVTLAAIGTITLLNKVVNDADRSDEPTITQIESVPVTRSSSSVGGS